MKKLFSLIVILAFVAVSCCKHHQPSKSSNTKQNPAEQQDTLPKPDPEPFPEPESNTVEYPLTIKTLEDSTVVSFYYEHWYEGINQYTDWTLSIDGGNTWAEPEWKNGKYDSKFAEFLILKAGTKVLVKGNQGKTNKCAIVFSKDCYVFGNLLSLIHWDDFATRTELTEERAFAGLFEGNNRLLNHPTLDILFPVTTVTEYACYYMFSGCSKLKRAPEIHAANAPYNCYEYMFKGCTELVKAPSVLPAEHVGSFAYSDMFQNCINMKEGPEIKADTADKCAFQEMFYNCSSLEKAPSLNIQTLPDNCCLYMFMYCEKLNYVECLSTSIDATNCLNRWLYRVASEGTFVTAKGMKDKWPRGESGIPSSWTVVEAE